MRYTESVACFLYVCSSFAAGLLSGELFSKEKSFEYEIVDLSIRYHIGYKIFIQQYCDDIYIWTVSKIYMLIR